MTFRSRLALTFSAGIVLGLNTLVAEDAGLPTAAANAALDTPLLVAAAVAFVLTPLVVGRPWVVGAMVGPLLALVAMQLAGISASLDDGTGPAFNYRTVFMLLTGGAVMACLTGLRTFLDEVRRRRAARQLDQPG